MGDIRIGNVERHLKQVIKERGIAHLTLFDPEKLTPKAAHQLALRVKKAGTAAFAGADNAEKAASVPQLAKIASLRVMWMPLGTPNS